MLFQAPYLLYSLQCCFIATWWSYHPKFGKTVCRKITTQRSPTVTLIKVGLKFEMARKNAATTSDFVLIAILYLWKTMKNSRFRYIFINLRIIPTQKWYQSMWFKFARSVLPFHTEISKKKYSFLFFIAKKPFSCCWKNPDFRLNEEKYLQNGWI